jgi:protein arginine kinase activator
MLCECCQQHEATIHLTQMINGQTRELHFCEDCAEENGMNVQSVISIPEILFGMGTAESDTSEEGKGGGKSCSHCHMRGRDFKKNARLGCPRCYESFGAELAPMLAAMHKGPRHVGKVPESRRQSLEQEGRLVALRKALEAAVQAEHYEEAALLRDQLREAGNEGG